MNLWPHQAYAIEQVRQKIREGYRRICVVMPMGAGKTKTAKAMIATHVSQGGKVVCWAHREELVAQMYDEIATDGLPVSCISASNVRPMNPNKSIQVCSIQTALARNYFPEATLSIYDECVTPDAIVGGKRADRVRVGDIVESWSDSGVVRRQVTRCFRKQATTLRSLSIADRTLTVTDSHPVWVEGKGFIEASHVEVGDLCRLRRPCAARCQGTTAKDLQQTMPGSVDLSPKKGDASRPQGVQDLRGPDCLERWPLATDVQSAVSERGFLSNDGCNKSPACFGPNAEAQSDEATGDPREGFEHLETTGSQASDSRRQWTRAHDASTISPASPRQWVDSRTCGASYGQQMPARALADRHRQSRPHDCDRSGRNVASINRCEGARSPQNGATYAARVDRIEVHERGSDGTFGGRCPDGTVYNFEVEGEHNFFANGVLTHNCHHASATEWAEIPRRYPNALLVGFTATPARGDGRALDAFQALVVGATIRGLTEDGFLVPCEVVSPAEALHGAIAQRPVDAYREFTPGQRAICFAPHTKAAEEYLADFLAAGYRAAFVHHKSHDRAKLIADYKAGKLDVLININILTEGFNDPPTSVVILARTVGHDSLYLQITGRGLRACEGKTKAWLLDLAGQRHIHGDPDEDREYSLSGDGIRRKGEKASVAFCCVCGAIIDAGAIVCSDCLRVRPELASPEVTNDPLVRYAFVRRRTPAQKRKHYFRMMTDLMEAGKSLGAAYYKYKAIYDEDPPWEWRQAWLATGGVQDG